MGVAPVIARSMKLSIEILKGSRAQEKIHFDKSRIRLGRAPDNELAFPTDLKMSRYHAEIYFENGNFFLKNLTERNIILVNNEKKSKALIDGEVNIKFGETEMKITLDGHVHKPVENKATLVALPTSKPVATAEPVAGNAFSLAFMNSSQDPNQAMVPVNSQQSQALEIQQQAATNLQTISPSLPQSPMYSSTPSFPPMPNFPTSTGIPGGVPPNSRARRLMSQSPKSRLNFIIGFAIIAVLGFLFLNQEQQKIAARKALLRGEEQVVADIDKSVAAVKEFEINKDKKNANSIQFKTAEENYKKGFRDYMNGQYPRAIQSFSAALSFYPSHELARKYYSQSKRKFDDLVQTHMINGRKEKGRGQFKLCKGSFAQVLIMLKEPTDPLYREAKQYYDECSLMTENN